MNQLSSLLLTALNAAKKAGKGILEIYHSGFEVEYKSNHSPLTIADKCSHEIIVAHLADQTNHPLGALPVLSEEGKNIPFKERNKWEYFWLVDPLDGTKEFIKRNGEFTVNIALINHSRPVLGVIFVPDKNVLYFAVERLGAYKCSSSDIIASISDSTSMKKKDELLRIILDGSSKLPLHDSLSTPPGSPKTIVGSRSHPTKELLEYVETMRKKYGRIRFMSAGSSLKLCMVAEGKADIYPRLGPTMEWDTAAGQAIVEQAHGSVLNSDTDESLQYNKKNLVNPWFIVRRKSV
jgi:3'(2'), 5'-bisphosphate nucleotidase